MTWHVESFVEVVLMAKYRCTCKKSNLQAPLMGEVQLVTRPTHRGKEHSFSTIGHNPYPKKA
jgi:hypothetical protein